MYWSSSSSGSRAGNDSCRPAVDGGLDPRHDVLQPPRVGEHVPWYSCSRRRATTRYSRSGSVGREGTGRVGPRRGRELRQARVAARGRAPARTPSSPPTGRRSPGTTRGGRRDRRRRVLRVDVEGEGLGDAEGLLVDQRRRRVVPLPAPPHPVQGEAVLLLVGALDQPDPEALARVGADDGVSGSPNRRRSPSGPGSSSSGRCSRALNHSEGRCRGAQRRVAVVDAHDAGVVDPADLVRRVERPPLPSCSGTKSPIARQASR